MAAAISETKYESEDSDLTTILEDAWSRTNWCPVHGPLNIHDLRRTFESTAKSEAIEVTCHQIKSSNRSQKC